MPASIPRRCLAIFLDLLMFSAVWHFCRVALGVDVIWFAMLPLFAVTRVVLGYMANTPGRALLSVDRGGEVDSEIKEGESWLTILMGVVFLWGGLSLETMWLDAPVPFPQFGFQPSPGLEAAICASWGAINILVGLLIFKLNRAGLVLGVTSSLLWVVSYFTSLDLMPDYWRAMFGPHLREILEPDEIELAMSMIAANIGFLVGGASLVMIVGLLFTMPRLTRTA